MICSIEVGPIRGRMIAAALLLHGLTWAGGSAALAQVYTFTTFVGSPTVTGSTDGTGSAALFNQPTGVAIDRVGNVFVVDQVNNTIRKVTPTRVVTTLAGLAGSPGSADGTASAARFNLPSNVTLDNSDNMYVADTSNHTIRKVTPAGVVTTLAGLAGVPGSADGTGSAARFNQPNGVALDSNGNLYVADGVNSTIRKVTLNGVVTTLAGLAGSSGSANGTGSAARFNFPEDVAVDTAGNVYVADAGNNTIRKVTPGGVVTTLAGKAGVVGSQDGTGSGALFSFPEALAVDSAGNVFVADYGNDTIRKVTPSGVVTTIGGLAGSTGTANGPGSVARFNGEEGIGVDKSGNVYVADTVNNTIRIGIPSGPVLLNIALLGGKAVLTWTNSAFALQSATVVSGPYTNVAGAISPYTNSLNTQCFFRLKAN
jgi:hypothetical protein